MGLIPEKENLYNEFKSDLKCLPDDEIIETIVGFANTQGGTLYLGVEDNGEVTGIHKNHMDITRLAAFIGNKTIPPQSVRIDIIEDKFQVIIVEVSKSRSIIATSSGKVMRRRLKLDGTPETVPMFPNEINSRISSLGLLDYSAQKVEGAKYDDLDPVERDRLRKNVRVNRGDKTLLELSDEELDKALQFVVTIGEELVPTITGLLVIGKEESIKKFIPTALSAFQVLVGTDVKVNDIYTKPIVATVERLEEYFNAWNPEREMEYGLIRMPIPEFNKRAFREAIINAYAHRDYAILQMVRVLIDDEGLTISSPGGFVEGVTLDNLLTVEPHGRNIALADALKRIGLAERTGRGIDRIYEGSLSYGRPIPDYTASDTNNVKLFIQRAKPDLAFTKMIADEENRLGRTLPIQSLLILSYLKEHRRLGLKQLKELTHLEEYRIRSTVEKLTEAGLVEAYGDNNARSYTLSSKMYQDNNNLKGYIRQKGIDRLRYQELIMELAKTQGEVCKKDVVELLHVSGPQAYRLLDRLKNEGKLRREGNTSATVYKLV